MKIKEETKTKVLSLAFCEDYGTLDGRGWFISPSIEGGIVYFRHTDNNVTVYQLRGETVCPAKGKPVVVGELLSYGSAAGGPNSMEKMILLCHLNSYAAQKLFDLDFEVPEELKKKWADVEKMAHALS